MKAKECTIGAEVWTEDGIMYRYTIQSLPDANGIVQVKPMKKSYGEMDSFHHDDLSLFDLEKIKKVAAELQSKVNAARIAFEAAFEALQTLHAADNSSINHYDLEQMGLLSTQELEQAIENGGWSSSSLWC